MYTDIKSLKKTVLRVLFAMEIVAFVGLYLFGTRGMHTLMELQNKQQELNLLVVDAQNEITALNEQIVHWKDAPFYKECIAREQLQMARPGDEVYYLNS